MEELLKVPDAVIIKQLQEEVKALRKKNHEICEKAKQREAHWKEYTDYLLNSINSLESDNEEEQKLRREVRAKKKMDADFKALCATNNTLVKKNECLKQQVKDLMDELEGKKVGERGISRKEMRKTFAKMKDKRGIMDEMLFAYNESMPIAYNSIVFLEWVRTNGKWEELYSLMYNLED